MTMQEESRYHQAAEALHQAGERVTYARMNAWLRERDGRGCSPRDAMPLVVLYRTKAEPRIEDAVSDMRNALDSLQEWERREAWVRLKRHYGRGA